MFETLVTLVPLLSDQQSSNFKSDQTHHFCNVLYSITAVSKYSKIPLNWTPLGSSKKLDSEENPVQRRFSYSGHMCCQLKVLNLDVTWLTSIAFEYFFFLEAHFVSNIVAFFLAFDFCQFYVVIRFFHPRHNGQ